jgi:MFS family permease
VILTAVYAFAFVDRQILNMLVGSIKAQFEVSDLMIGYLIGPAFILSFMLVGLPAGLGVDRWNRRNLVLGAGFVWSGATAMAAFAESFTTLVISRAMVGAAEAVVFPAGISMIADMFERRHLPTANSVFLTAPYVGGGIALIAGGMVLQFTESIPFVPLPLGVTIAGWQTTFLIVAAAGILPVLLLFAVTEPDRSRGRSGEQEAVFGVLAGLSYLMRHWRFYAFFYFGMATAGLVMAMVAAWAPTYLARGFGMQPAQIGVTYGTVVLFAGLAGGISGPLVNRWMRSRFPHPTMYTACLAPLMILVLATTLIFEHSAWATMACLALFTMSYSFPLSTAGTSLQIVTPPILRGTASAVYLIFNSMIGYAMGPAVVPLAAVHLFGSSDAIGPALKLMAILCGALSFIFLFLAARGFVAEADRLEREAAG